MNKIKQHFRFSYFLVLGIIGFILQFISFFSFSKEEITKSNLTASSTTSYFTTFITSSIILAISCVFIIAMFVGYIIGKKKKQSLLFTVSSGTAIFSQVVIMVSTIVYLIFASNVRRKMYTINSGNMEVIDALVLIKFIGLLISYASTSLFAYCLFDVKKHSKLSKVSGYALLGVNAIMFLMLTVVMSTQLVNETYSMLTNFYELKKFPPYTNAHYPSFNGFTLAQLERLDMVISADCVGREGVSIFASSARFAIANQILYLVAIAGNLFWAVIQLIESFDVNRDENLMEI